MKNYDEILLEMINEATMDVIIKISKESLSQ
jgi:hypothetical protein